MPPTQTYYSGLHGKNLQKQDALLMHHAFYYTGNSTALVLVSDCDPLAKFEPNMSVKQIVWWTKSDLRFNIINVTALRRTPNSLLPLISYVIEKTYQI